MTLPAVVDSLDSVPEEFRGEYKEQDGKHVLAVGGIQDHPKVTSLAKAYEDEKEKAKRRSQRLQEFGDTTPEDLENLRAELAEAREGADIDVEAKIQEVKEKLEAKYEGEKGKLQKRAERLREELHRLLVDNELSTALDEAGVKPEYRPAVRAMLKEKDPTVVEDGDEMIGVFKEGPDGIPGDVRISNFVEQWSESEDAKPYLPASGKQGSGSEPGGSTGEGAGAGGVQTIQRGEGGVVRTDPQKILDGEVVVAGEE